jgi:hypothetical protein
MIMPNEYWNDAVRAGEKWLDDPATEILYVDDNGIVMRNNKRELSIRVYPRQISFEVLP